MGAAPVGVTCCGHRASARHSRQEGGTANVLGKGRPVAARAWQRPRTPHRTRVTRLAACDIIAVARPRARSRSRARSAPLHAAARAHGDARELQAAARTRIASARVMPHRLVSAPGVAATTPRHTTDETQRQALSQRDLGLGRRAVWRAWAAWVAGRPGATPSPAVAAPHAGDGAACGRASLHGGSSRVLESSPEHS